MIDADVIVVGAGLTGLRAAYEISRAGASVLVLEKADAVGGRVRSTAKGGFILDHGFQVLPSAYSELKTIEALDSLDLKPFSSGARIFTGSGFFDLLDYRSGIKGLLSLLRAPCLSFVDLYRLAAFSLAVDSSAPKITGVSTLSAVKSFGFSSKCIEQFLIPFLSGVLLDDSLSLDSGAARFYMGVFARGQAMLPAHGMQAFPNLLASQVGESHVLLSAEVVQLTSREVVLANGDTLQAKRVICAIDGLRAAELGSPEQTIPFGSCTTLYFSARTAPFTDSLLVLNGSGKGIVNHLAVVSNVQPSYAPAGESLIAVTAVDRTVCSLNSQGLLIGVVREQLSEWYGREQVNSWTHLHTFSIPHAVPLRPRFSEGFCEQNGVYYAGDYLSYGAQNGALAAGRAVARAVLESVEYG